jgi:hypothetical protein
MAFNRHLTERATALEGFASDIEAKYRLRDLEAYKHRTVDPFITSTRLALTDLANLRATTDQRLFMVETSTDKLPQIAHSLLSALDATWTETEGSRGRKVDDSAFTSWRRHVDDNNYSLTTRIAKIEEFKRNTKVWRSTVDKRLGEMKEDVKVLTYELNRHRNAADTKLGHLSGTVSELWNVCQKLNDNPTLPRSRIPDLGWMEGFPREVSFLSP